VPVADKDDEDYLIANLSSHMLNSSQASAVVSEKPAVVAEAETKISFDTPSSSSTSNSPSKFGVINFKSKIKPNKKIELVEVRNGQAEDACAHAETHALLEDVAKTVVVVESVVSDRDG
jgi:hypothetical protein